MSNLLAIIPNLSGLPEAHLNLLRLAEKLKEFDNVDGDYKYDAVIYDYDGEVRLVSSVNSNQLFVQILSNGELLSFNMYYDEDDRQWFYHGGFVLAGAQMGDGEVYRIELTIEEQCSHIEAYMDERAAD